MASVLRWARWLAHASISPWGLVGTSSRTDMLRPWNTACRWLYFLYCFWQCLHTFVMFLLNLTVGTFFPLDFTSKCRLNMNMYAISSMMAQQWFLGNSVQWAGCSKGIFWHFRKTESAQEEESFYYNLLSQSTRPRWMKHWSAKVPALKDLLDRPLDLETMELVDQAMRTAGFGDGYWSSLLGNDFRSLKPQGSAPECVLDPASLFGRIQRRENATDGSGGRHPGAGRGGSQRSSGGHAWCRAGREEGRKMLQLAAGRAVVPVLEPGMAIVAELWIRVCGEQAPSHGGSCEHFDDPTGRRGRKGEPHVFARSGFNSPGILFFDPQMIEILIHRWNEESNPCDFWESVFVLMVSDYQTTTSKASLNTKQEELHIQVQQLTQECTRLKEEESKRQALTLQLQQLQLECKDLRKGQEESECESLKERQAVALQLQELKLECEHLRKKQEESERLKEESQRQALTLQLQTLQLQQLQSECEDLRTKQDELHLQVQQLTYECECLKEEEYQRQAVTLEMKQLQLECDNLKKKDFKFKSLVAAAHSLKSKVEHFCNECEKCDAEDASSDSSWEFVGISIDTAGHCFMREAVFKASEVFCLGSETGAYRPCQTTFCSTFEWIRVLYPTKFSGMCWNSAWN